MVKMYDPDYVEYNALNRIQTEVSTERIKVFTGTSTRAGPALADRASLTQRRKRRKVTMEQKSAFCLKHKGT